MSRARSPLLVLFLTVFIDMVGFGIVIPVLPLYAERFAASPMAIGWLTGIARRETSNADSACSTRCVLCTHLLRVRGPSSRFAASG